MSHPLQPGDRVYHGGQIWARSLPGGTGEVLRVKGPDHRGDYEYLVRCGQEFSRRTGTDNPETCEKWWSSYHTNPAKEASKIEPQAIRVQITKGDARFFEGDLRVYPWHIGNYGGDWGMWLRTVAPEWVGRVAGGIREETFRATATDLGRGEQLANVEFVHSTPKTVTVTVENKAAAQLSEGLDKLFRRLGPPSVDK